jgi:hypothetical protein
LLQEWLSQVYWLSYEWTLSDKVFSNKKHPNDPNDEFLKRRQRGIIRESMLKILALIWWKITLTGSPCKKIIIL